MADSSGYASELAQFASAQNANDILAQTRSAKEIAEKMHNASVGELLISLGLPAGKQLAQFAAARSPVVKKLLDTASDAKDAVDGVQDSIRGAKDTIENTIDNTRETLDNQISSARQTAEDTVNEARSTAENAVSEARDTAEGAVNEARDTAEGAVTEARDTATAAVSDAQDAAASAVSEAQGAVSDAQDAAASAVSEAQGAVSDAQDAAASAVSEAQGAVSDARDAATSAVSDAQDAAASAVSDAVDSSTAVSDAVDSSTAVGDAASTFNAPGSLLAEAADSPAMSDFRSYSDIISQSEAAAREPTLADLINTGRTPVRSMGRRAQDLIDDADPESDMMEGQIGESLDPTMFTTDREPPALEDISAPMDVEMQNMGAQQQAEDESEDQPSEEPSEQPSEPVEGEAPAETDAGEGVIDESEAAEGVEAGEDVAEGVEAAEGAGDAAGILSGVVSAEEVGGLLDAAGLPEVGVLVGAAAGLVSLGVGLKEIFDGGSHSAPPPPLAQAVYEPGAETSTA